MASSTASPAAASSAAPDCRRKKRSAGRQPPCLDAGGSTDRSPVMPARPNGLHFVALDSKVARALRGGAPDANCQAPARPVSDGDGERKSVVSGQNVSVRVELGGSRII